MAVDLVGHEFTNVGGAINDAVVDIFTVATGADENTSSGSATASTTTDETGLWDEFNIAAGTYDVRIKFGSEIRWLRGEDQIQIAKAEVSTAVKTQDAADVMFGSGEDALIRWSTGDADNHSLVIAVGDSNQSLHITDKGAVATDWDINATTHPNVYVHSNTTPATDYLRLGDHDGTTAYVDVVGGTTLALEIAGNTELTVTSAGLNLPANSDINFTGTTGTNDIKLTDSLADALSIVHGSTDMVVFDSNTPSITFTPVTTFTGTITGPSGTWDSGGVDIAASDSYAVDGTAILSDSSGTMTLSNVDALDATTEATIEGAIDTLSNLASVGTITTGVWQGTDVGVAYGGTGVSTLTANGVLVGNGSSAIGSVDMSTKGHVLIGDGSGNPQTLGVGTDTHVLTADSGETTGIKWAAPAAAAAGSLTGSTLASGVTASSLTSVGAVSSGSITSGFGTIDTGSSTITTTGAVTSGTAHITGSPETLIEDLIVAQQNHFMWHEFDLGAIGASYYAVTGSGSIGVDDRSIDMLTGATASSTVKAATHVQAGLSNGAHKNVLDWSKKVILVARVTEAGSTATGDRWVLLGRNPSDSPGDLDHKGLGFRIDGSQNIYAQYHDGSSLVTTDCGVDTVGNKVATFVVVAAGDGTAKFYVDGTLRVTAASGCPTGDSSTSHNVVHMSTINGGDSAQNRLIVHSIVVGIEQQG